MADLDIYSKLQAPAWRGIPFPCASMDNSFTHDHVEHKFIYLDGVHIEATGRNGLIMHAIMPFHNGVQGAPNEGWLGQVLYPDLFSKMLVAVRDRSSGVLLHPELGPIGAKARDVQWRNDAASGRDGVTLSVRFYESNDADQIEGLIAQQSPIASAIAAAGTLDSELAAAQKKADSAKKKDPHPGPLQQFSNIFEESFKNDKKSFTTLVDDFQSGGGNLSPLNSKINQTSSALDRLNSVDFWPIRTANENMKAAAIDLGTSNSRTNQPILNYRVPGDTSMQSISIQLRVKLPDLITLNPNLAYDPLVPRGTQIKYYAGAP